MIKYKYNERKNSIVTYMLRLFFKEAFNMFDFDIIDLFNSLDWDKKSYKFNRDEKDMHPYSIMNLKDKTLIVHNVLGVDKKDLKLSFEKENGVGYILINGKTVDEYTKNRNKNTIIL